MRSAFVRPTSLLLAVLTVAGCASGDLSAAPGDRGAIGSGAGDYEDANSAAQDSSTPVTSSQPAAFYGLDGLISIEAGSLVLGGSALTVGYWDEDVHRLCVTTYLLDEATPIPNSDVTIPLFGWWDLELGFADDCDDYPLPVQLFLGIGAYDPLLDPAVAASTAVTTDVYGLYLQDAPGEPVNVFGVAGTPDILEGQDEPVDAAPLPDGVYELVGLHLLPIDG